jgi:hypothetical protein
LTLIEKFLENVRSISGYSSNQNTVTHPAIVAGTVTELLSKTRASILLNTKNSLENWYVLEWMDVNDGWMVDNGWIVDNGWM